MLLYDSQDSFVDAAKNWINFGLENNQLCVYASVHAFDDAHKSSVSCLTSKIKDYQQNFDKGNILVINFKPYYESALEGDLQPFNALKSEIEQTIVNRAIKGKGDRVLIFADAACCLSENKTFTESEDLERWWQQTHDKWVKEGQHITVVCPHPKSVLNENLVAKARIGHQHDLTIDYDQQDLDSLLRNKQILIAEPETDLGSLYLDYLSRLGAEVMVTNNCVKCLSAFREKDYDLVILDTHLCDCMAFDIAKEIRITKPFQRIALTTTHSLGEIVSLVQSLGINTKDILLKPFLLSRLQNVIEEN